MTGYWRQRPTQHYVREWQNDGYHLTLGTAVIQVLFLVVMVVGLTVVLPLVF